MLVALLLGLSALSASAVAQPSNDVREEVRDEPVQAEARTVLSQYGRFVQHARFGEVWVPTVTPQGWHPYPPCHWVKTKQYGWYYDDKTPWGQIVHHYGRWFWDQQIGWAWDPGSEFSPGWVVWRTQPRMDGLGADAAGPGLPEHFVRSVQQQRSVDFRRDREVQRGLRRDADGSGRTRSGAAAPDQMDHGVRISSTASSSSCCRPT